MRKSDRNTRYKRFKAAMAAAAERRRLEREVAAQPKKKGTAKTEEP